MKPCDTPSKCPPVKPAGTWNFWSVRDLLANNELVRVLSERAEPWIVFAEYQEEHLTEGLIKGERIDLINAAYPDAISYLGKEEEIKPVVFFKIYQYYMKQSR